MNISNFLSSLVWMALIPNAWSFCDESGRFCAYGTTASGYNILTVHSAAKGWTSIGIGTSMASCTEIYVIWKDSNGGLVLSPRNSSSYSMPKYNHVSKSYLTNLQYRAPEWANFAASIVVPYRLDNNTRFIYASSDVAVETPNARNSNFNKHDLYGRIDGMDFPETQINSLNVPSKAETSTQSIGQQKTGWYPGKNLERIFMPGSQPNSFSPGQSGFSNGQQIPQGGMPSGVSNGQQPINSWGGQQPINSWGGQQPINSWGGQQPTSAWSGQQPINSWSGQQPTSSWNSQQPLNTWSGQQPTNAWNGQQPSNSWTGQQYQNGWNGQSWGSQRPQNSWNGQQTQSWNGQSWGSQRPQYSWNGQAQTPSGWNGQQTQSWNGQSWGNQRPQSVW